MRPDALQRPDTEDSDAAPSCELPIQECKRVTCLYVDEVAGERGNRASPGCAELGSRLCSLHALPRVAGNDLRWQIGSAGSSQGSSLSRPACLLRAQLKGLPACTFNMYIAFLESAMSSYC